MEMRGTSSRRDLSKLAGGGQADGTRRKEGEGEKGEQAKHISMPATISLHTLHTCDSCCLPACPAWTTLPTCSPFLTRHSPACLVSMFHSSSPACLTVLSRWGSLHACCLPCPHRQTILGLMLYSACVCLSPLPAVLYSAGSHFCLPSPFCVSCHLQHFPRRSAYSSYMPVPPTYCALAPRHHYTCLWVWLGGGREGRRRRFKLLPVVCLLAETFCMCAILWSYHYYPMPSAAVSPLLLFPACVLGQNHDSFCLFHLYSLIGRKKEEREERGKEERGGRDTWF